MFLVILLNKLAKKNDKNSSFLVQGNEKIFGSRGPDAPPWPGEGSGGGDPPKPPRAKPIATSLHLLTYTPCPKMPTKYPCPPLHVIGWLFECIRKKEHHLVMSILVVNVLVLHITVMHSFHIHGDLMGVEYRRLKHRVWKAGSLLT